MTVKIIAGKHEGYQGHDSSGTWIVYRKTFDNTAVKGRPIDIIDSIEQITVERKWYLIDTLIWLALGFGLAGELGLLVGLVAGSLGRQAVFAINWTDGGRSLAHGRESELKWLIESTFPSGKSADPMS